MATVSDRVRRQRLVSALRANGTLNSAAVIAAFEAVPRSRFVPEGTSPEDAYGDHALVLTADPSGRPTSTISQPSMVALMLEQLGAGPGHRVLEVGTASGYTAALVAGMVRPSGRVVTMELDPELAKTAAERLADRWPEATVRSGDGWSGAPDEAPFDRVHVTVGVDDLSPRWLEQLTDGGLLVAPITLRPSVELSVAFERRGAQLVSRSVRPCGFVRLRGPHAAPSSTLVLDGVGTVLADCSDETQEQQLRSVLAAPPVDGGPIGAVSEGWAVRLALEQPHPLAVLRLSPRLVIQPGLYDPEGGGVALVDGDRLIGHGHCGALHKLREQLADGDPLSQTSLRLTARPAGDELPPGRWTVHKRHFNYAVDLD
ncbi:MAG: protein-L-isoaspartate O-methyltransferase family protein [Pseudonocardiaceae bacterium]